MQWIVGHGPKLCVIVIYVRYQNTVSSLQWNVESTSKLDFEEANTPMGPNGPHSELIYHDDTIYDGWSSKFTLIHKSVLVIMQGNTKDSEKGLQIGLID